MLVFFIVYDTRESQEWSSDRICWWIIFISD